MTQSQLFEDFKRMMEQLSPDVTNPGLELLLQQMEPDDAQLFRLCGIPHQFNEKLIPILMPEASSDWAQQKCNEFAELSFVVPSSNGWQIHDTARNYLFNEWLKSEHLSEFALANSRLVEFIDDCIKNVTGYTFDFAQRARMFHLIGADQKAGIENFIRLFQEARHQFNLSECESLIKLVHEYDPILEQSPARILKYHEGKLAYDQRKWNQAEQLLREIIEDQGTTGELEIKVLNRLGMVHEARREWPAAIDIYQKALQTIGSNEEYIDLKARVFHNLGIAKRESNELKEAEDLLNESVRLHEGVGSYRSAATAYNSLGNLYRQLNDSKNAINAYENALACLEKGNDRFRTAQLYNNLGLMYGDMTDWDNSKKYFQESLEIKKKAGDTLGQANTLNNLVRVYQSLDLRDRAIESAQEAIKLFNTVHDDFSLAKAKRNLAKLYHSMGKDQQAQEAFADAITTFDRLKEIDLSNETRAEQHALDENIGIPWWAWTAIGVFGLLITIIIIAIAMAEL